MQLYAFSSETLHEHQDLQFRFCRSNKTYWIQLQDLAWATWPTKLSSEILHEQHDQLNWVLRSCMSNMTNWIQFWDLVRATRLTEFNLKSYTSTKTYSIQFWDLLLPLTSQISGVCQFLHQPSPVQHNKCNINIEGILWGSHICLHSEQPHTGPPS